MLPRHKPNAAYGYQFLTFGFYYLYWAARSGGEVNRALGRKEVPTAWWFILPFGNYWWMWQYANGLHDLSGGRIKLADTFAYYLIAVNLWIIMPFTNISGWFSNSTLKLIFNVLYIACFYCVWIVGHAFFIAVTQKKINQLEAAAPTAPANAVIPQPQQYGQPAAPPQPTTNPQPPVQPPTPSDPSHPPQPPVA